MKDAADNKLDVNVWTVNEAEHIKKCCDLGVNAIITNYPDLAREIVDAI